MAEETLTPEEVELELEFAGVSRGHIVKILSWCETYGYKPAELDRKLVSLGFEKVFTIYDDLEMDED
jgi:hypothetical protein